MIRTKCIFIITMVLVVFFCGCQLFNKPSEQPVEEVSPVVTDQKTVLLDQIEQRYENPEAHYQLGQLYYADGMFEKAEFEYKVALGFDPVHYKAQAAIVNVLLARNNEARSSRATEIYMNQAAVSEQASLRLGKAFQKEGLDEYALACYQQAQILAPESAVPFKQIGYYYLEKGDTVRAEENLRQSFQLDPYQSEVAEELGRIGVMVQIPQEPIKENFLKKLFKKKDPPEEELDNGA